MKKVISNIGLYAMLFVLMVCSVNAAQPTVDLGVAQNFSIVAQTLISDIAPYTIIVGDINMDPAAGSFIHDVSCTEVTGTIYDNNAGYTGGWDSNVSCLVTDANKTLAVQSAMVAAYNDARGRVGTNTTELGSGHIGGLTLYPGLYKWSSAVDIATDVTLDCLGDSNAVFIMQMSQTLDVSNNKRVILNGSCQASNIFWQADTGVTLGTTTVFNGNILAGTAIIMNTGFTLNGRAFAQTAVTMDAGHVYLPESLNCTEDWIQHYTSCIGGHRTITYTDNNDCGTIFSLPANNGTVVHCGGGGTSNEVYPVTDTIPPANTTELTAQTTTPTPTPSKGLTDLQIAGIVILGLLVLGWIAGLFGKKKK